MFTTGLLDTVAARCPSGICLAEGVVIRPVVPKSEALAVLIANAGKANAKIKGNLFLAKVINAVPGSTKFLIKREMRVCRSPADLTSL